MTGALDEPACWSWPVPERPGRGEAALLRWHANRCGICGDEATGRNRHRDHDHETGLLRGLLCRGCNLHEGHCARRSCVCARWRERNSATILGISVMFKGTDSSWAGYYRRRGERPPTPQEAGRSFTAVMGRIIADDLEDDGMTA